MQFYTVVQTISWAAPNEVMEPYKAYNKAYQSEDYLTALEYGKKAWLAAEKQLGDHKTTGDLAFNYGKLASQLGHAKVAIKPLMRSADLAVLAKENGAMIRLEREVELGTAMLASKQNSKAWKRLDKAREFAGVNKLDDGLFAAELRVHQARILNTNANWKAKYSDGVLASNARLISINGAMPKRTQSRSGQYAQSAIDIFDKYPGIYREDYVAMAYKFVGFAHERDQQWLEAALAYQNAMGVLKKYLELEDEKLITTIYRWSISRSRLLVRMDRDEAMEKGLCACWPFEDDVERIAQPIERKPPKMPSKSFIPGFSFVQFDLDDEGNTMNVRVLRSWPESVHDNLSLSSVEEWKYEPRTPEETEAQREKFVVVIGYFVNQDSINHKYLNRIYASGAQGHPALNAPILVGTPGNPIR